MQKPIIRTSNHAASTQQKYCKLETVSICTFWCCAAHGIHWEGRSNCLRRRCPAKAVHKLGNDTVAVNAVEFCRPWLQRGTESPLLWRPNHVAVTPPPFNRRFIVSECDGNSASIRVHHGHRSTRDRRYMGSDDSDHNHLGTKLWNNNHAPDNN